MSSDFARSWAERVRSICSENQHPIEQQTDGRDIIRGDVAKICNAGIGPAVPRLQCCPDQEDARFRALRDASLVSMGMLPFSFLHPDPRDPEQQMRDQTRMALAQAEQAGLRVISHQTVKLIFHKDHQWTALRALSCATRTDPYSRHYPELSRALAVARMQNPSCDEQKLIELYSLLAGQEVRFCGGRPKGFAAALRESGDLLELMDQVPGWTIRKPKVTDFARLRKPGAGRHRVERRRVERRRVERRMPGLVVQREAAVAA